jgi:small-conductance mechanosensitive channel/CRP-like cAMP-binding protein
MPLFRLGRDGISLLWILQILGLLILVSLLARGIKHVLKRYLLNYLGIREGRREAIATLTSFSLAALGYILIVQAMGLDLSSLAVILGGLGVGLGFGLQDLTKNLTSGLTLLMEGKLKVGDLVEFDHTKGYIQEISIRATVIRTFQGSEIVVPNTYLTNSPVKNLSYNACDGRVEVPLTVSHNCQPMVVTEILLQAAFMEPNIQQDPPPKVVFLGLGERGLCFELWVWIARIDNSLSIKSSLNFAINQYFRERGIQLATSQTVLQLKPPEGLIESDEIAVETETAKAELSEPVIPLTVLLPQLPYFQGLTDLQLRNLIESGGRRELATGEVLVRQGEFSNVFCIVLSGSINAIYETGKISRRLFTFETGQFFGELPLLLKVPYPTTMRADTATTLFMVHGRGFQTLLDNYSAFAEEVAQELTRRKEVLQTYQSYLREHQLLDDEDMKNPLGWIRDRLKKVFSAKPLPPMIEGSES